MGILRDKIVEAGERPAAGRATGEVWMKTGVLVVSVTRTRGGRSTHSATPTG